MTPSFKKELFQDMVSYYGNIFSLPPLSAKVYVYLMFDFKREGITFDELVDTFKVSKSSVSASLHTLLQNKHIEYVTGIDSRKRLFRTNAQFTFLRFNEVLNNLSKEKELINRLICYKNQSGCKAMPVSKGLGEYVGILDKHIKTISGTLNKLKR